jgi:hypothetical protein
MRHFYATRVDLAVKVPINALTVQVDSSYR